MVRYCGCSARAKSHCCRLDEHTYVFISHMSSRSKCATADGRGSFWTGLVLISLGSLGIPAGIGMLLPTWIGAGCIALGFCALLDSRKGTDDQTRFRSRAHVRVGGLARRHRALGIGSRLDWLRRLLSGSPSGSPAWGSRNGFESRQHRRGDGCGLRRGCFGRRNRWLSLTHPIQNCPVQVTLNKRRQLVG